MLVHAILLSHKHSPPVHLWKKNESFSVKKGVEICTWSSAVKLSSIFKILEIPKSILHNGNNIWFHCGFPAWDKQFLTTRIFLWWNLILQWFQNTRCRQFLIIVRADVLNGNFWSILVSEHLYTIVYNLQSIEHYWFWPKMRRMCFFSFVW